VGSKYLHNREWGFAKKLVTKFSESLTQSRVVITCTTRIGIR